MFFDKKTDGTMHGKWRRCLALFLATVILSLSAAGCGLTQTKAAVSDNYRNYYEIFVRSFYDSDGDGIGDLQGIIEKLDYIQDMGFDGIWLMPIMPSATYHKYDVIDYMDIAKEYGTMDDFDALVKACHKKGIRIIIDMVMNHSSSQNKWFESACDYLKTLGDGEEPDETACPYAGYYNFSNKKESSTWYNVAGTDWYYEGSFWEEMPDLNLENAALRKEFEKISDFWISHGVDGYRMDAAMHYEENDAAANEEILSWIYNYCKKQNPDFYMVSEVWAGSNVIASYYKSGTPSMFNFPASSAEGNLVKAARGTLSASQFVTSLVNWQDTYTKSNPDYIDAPFLTNHDQVRVANNLMSDENDLKMAAGLLMTMSGSTFVYYGEEIGMKSAGQADENKRLPMNWSETDTTGITNPPDGADTDVEQTFPAQDEQEKDSDSLLNYYKRAIALRKDNPEIARGTISLVEDLCNDKQAAITRTWKDSTIGVLYNTTDEPITVALTGTELEKMKVAGYLTLDNSKIVQKDGSVTLPAQSICVLR